MVSSLRRRRTTVPPGSARPRPPLKPNLLDGYFTRWAACYSRQAAQAHVWASRAPVGGPAPPQELPPGPSSAAAAALCTRVPTCRLSEHPAPHGSRGPGCWASASASAASPAVEAMAAAETGRGGEQGEHGCSSAHTDPLLSPSRRVQQDRSLCIATSRCAPDLPSCHAYWQQPGTHPTPPPQQPPQVLPPPSAYLQAGLAA